MSILFKIKNKNEPQKDYPDINVLIDDNLSLLKERLYALTVVGKSESGELEPDFDLYPNLLKIEIVINEVNDETIVIRDNINPLLNNYEWNYIPSQPTVIFTTLKNELEKYNILELFVKMGTEEYDNVFNKLKEDFIDLTKTDFDMILYLAVYLKKADDSSIILDDKDLQTVIEYVNTTLRNKFINLRTKVLKNKYNDIIAQYDTDQFKKYFSIDKEEYDEENDIYYTSVSVNIIGKNVESGIRGKFIKLRNIFNTIELNEDFPFVSIGLDGSEQEEGQRNPLIKVYDRLNKMISEREFRGWVLTERKKEEKASYKKVKGLHFRVPIVFDDEEKTKFLFINLGDNGVINAKVLFEEDDNMQNLNIIIDIILKKIDDVILYISELGGIFLRDKRLLLTEESSISIYDINCFIKIPMNISRNSLISTLSKNDIKSRAFELKDIKSVQFLSMYYKKYTSKSDGDLDESEKRGITINIKDDPYKENSCIIVVYGSDSILQILTLTKQLIIINDMSQTTQQKSLFIKKEEQKRIKKKSHIKLLKKKGVKISSKKCPQFKLPNVDDDTKPLDGSYILEFDGKKYTCQNPQYKYPGFTMSNDVCCFKKDQRSKTNYIRNMGNEYQITLHPSNYKITIQNNDNNNNENSKFETYVLKISNEYLEMKKRDPNIPLYYWLDNDKLIPITDKNLNKKIINMDIRTDGKIWFEDAVPLSVLIGDSAGTNCKYLPDFKNYDRMNINKKCEHYETNKFFGYNLNSYPCCFHNERDLIINRQRKRPKTKHIFNTDKLLEHERIGVLQSYLNKLFNEFNDIDQGKNNKLYYRMGVTQNNSAFFNAILIAIEEDERLNLKSSTQFRNFLIEYLKLNENEYKKFNNGLVALKYGNVSNYIEWLEDYTNYMNPNDTLDLVKMAIGYNIIIFDIPYKYADSTKVPDYENIRLKCQNYHMIGEKKNGYDLNKPFIILIKKEKTYELMIMIEDGVDNIIKSFKYDENDIIKFLYEYYINTCIKDAKYPENYKFDKLESAVDIIDLFKDTDHKIKYEVINAYNKVIYLLTNSGVLIPVTASGISFESIKLSKLISDGNLLTLDKLIIKIDDINRILNKEYLKIIGITKDNRGVLTNLGQIIPISGVVNKDLINDYEKLDYPYYDDVDEYLVGDKIYKNIANDYINKTKGIKQMIYKVKTVLAKILSQKIELKKYIEEINVLSIPRITKIQYIVDVFNKIYDKLLDKIDIFKDITKDNIVFIFKVIANEIIDDNRDNLLLNNLVISDVFDPKEIIKRDDEQILMNIDDIQKWMRISTE